MPHSMPLCVCERDGLSIVVTSSKDQSGKPAGRWGRGFFPPYLEKKLEDRSSLPLARVFLVVKIGEHTDILLGLMSFH